MAGASVAVDISGDDAVIKLLREYQRRAGDVEPALRDIGEALLLSHDERWDRQESPDGTPWAALSEAYQKSERKRESRGADKILVLDSYLRKLNYKTSYAGLQLGSGKKYAAAHQFGYKHIPARPYLGFSQDDADNALDIIYDYLLNG